MSSMNNKPKDQLGNDLDAQGLVGLLLEKAFIIGQVSTIKEPTANEPGIMTVVTVTNVSFMPNKTIPNLFSIRHPQSDALIERVTNTRMPAEFARPLGGPQKR